MSADIDIRLLLTECCSGSETAWARFFELFHPLIAGTVRKTVNADEEDIIQAIYLKLIDSDYALLKKFRGTTFYEFLNFVRQIAFHTATNQRRAQGKEQARIAQTEDLGTLLSASPNPEASFLQREASAEIMACVMRLDIKYREPVFLLIEGFKHKEIAEILKIPIDTASTRIRRAYEKLEKELKNWAAS
ncbi:MAG: RNA polymerase sigma factor [Spirochaetes bacterium]|nr:RNA polymerase sigma factor [Spirochaetota bacterium]